MHHLPKYLEKFLIEYDPNKKAKVEDHIDEFYLYLRMLEVCFDDVSCRIVPYALEGRTSSWYHSLLPNSIHNWRESKPLFLENFVDDKTLAILLK